MDGLDVAIDAGARLSRPSPQPTRHVRKSRFRQLLPFFLFVVVPTCATAGYLYGFAADQYMSEAKFVVRGPSQQTSGALANLLQTAGASRAQDETYAVQEFMLSRDALRQLVNQEDLKAVFARPEADILSRFPNYFADDDFEHLFKYYLNHVDVELDTTSGISKITVKSFRASDSQRIAAALLASGERLVNQMNDRERENALKDARKEVQLSEQRVQGVAASIADYRNKQAILDPNRQSVPMLQAIANLQVKLGALKLEQSQLPSNSPLLPGRFRFAYPRSGACRQATRFGDGVTRNCPGQRRSAAALPRRGRAAERAGLCGLSTTVDGDRCGVCEFSRVVRSICPRHRRCPRTHARLGRHSQWVWFTCS